MLQLFRNNTPYTVLILFIFTLLVKLQVLVHPLVPQLLPDHFLYNSIIGFLGTILGQSAFGFTMLAVVLLFGQSIYMTNIIAKHRLFMKPSYLTAFAYISLASIFPAFGYFSPQLLINWVLLMAVDIILRFTQPQSPGKLIFNVGFLLCLAMLISFSAVGFLLFFIIALIILRPFNASEWVVAMLGYLTPVYFFAGILFLTDQLPLLRKIIGLGISLPAQIPHPLYQVGCVVGILILFSAGIYVLNDARSRQAISVRRGWTSIVVYFVVALPVCIFTPKMQEAAWLCCIPPLALLTSQPLNLERNKRFSNFVFYFFIVLVVFCQFTVHK